MAKAAASLDPPGVGTVERAESRAQPLGSLSSSPSLTLPCWELSKGEFLHHSVKWDSDRTYLLGPGFEDSVSLHAAEVSAL